MPKFAVEHWVLRSAVLEKQSIILLTSRLANSSIFSVAPLTFVMLVSLPDDKKALRYRELMDLVFNYGRQITMKKTLLAIAIPALLVSAANAATVYDKDGTQFDVYGRAQANLNDATNAAMNYDSSATRDTVNTSGRIGLKGQTALTSQVAALGRLEYQVNTSNEYNADGSATADGYKGFKVRHAYVGFDGKQAGTVVFGKTDTAYYDTLAATDIFNEWGDKANKNVRPDGQVIYRGTWGGYRASAGYQFADASSGVKDGYNGSLGYTFGFGLGFGVGGEVRNYDQGVGSNTNLDTDKRWAINTTYGTFGKDGLYAAALYNQSTKSYFADADTKDKGWELATAYTKGKWTGLAGYNRYATEGETAKTSYYLLGAMYNFTTNFNVYTEVRFENGKDSAGNDLSNAYTLAAQYNF